MDLGKLVSEKNEILKKIEKLEQIKDDIRESVYSKIKEDYSQKLDEIGRQIAESSEGLKQRMDEIENEMSDLKSYIDSNEEKVEEIKVRNALGDISDDELKTISQPIEEDIAEKKGRLGELEIELAELRDMSGNDTQAPAQPEPVSEEQLAQNIDDMMGMPHETEEISEEPADTELTEEIPEMQDLPSMPEEEIAEQPAEETPELMPEMPAEEIMKEAEPEELPDMPQMQPEGIIGEEPAEELPPMQELMQEDKPVDDDIRQDLDMIMKIAESNEDVSEELESMNMQNNPEQFNDSKLEDTQSEHETPINNILQPEIMQEDVFRMDQTIDEKDKLVNENPLDRGENAENTENELQDIERIFEADLPNPEDAKQEEHIDGLKCPKCGYINKPDLFNCEKCGSELL